MTYKKRRQAGSGSSPGALNMPRRSTFRRLFAYARKFWPMLAALEICIVGSALLDVARPWIIGFQLFAWSSGGRI